MSFPQRWIDGLDPNEPLLQVHQYSHQTWIMRQSLHSHWEAPFLYLLTGEERAFLIDTGAPGELPLRSAVDRIIGDHIPLIVAHSHAHGDHLAGDSQFAGRRDTVIVGHSPQDVARFFGIGNWPEEIVQLNLGGRVLDVIPIPGHDPASIALYDGQTRLLLTNDTLYPGRLYVRDFQAFRASVGRLVSFVTDREVSWVMGSHIEMTNEAGADFKLAAPTHPKERRLQLSRNHLFELWEATQAMGDTPVEDIHDDFIVVPVAASG